MTLLKCHLNSPIRTLILCFWRNGRAFKASTHGLRKKKTCISPGGVENGLPALPSQSYKVSGSGGLTLLLCPCRSHGAQLMNGPQRSASCYPRPDRTARPITPEPDVTVIYPRDYTITFNLANSSCCFFYLILGEGGVFLFISSNQTRVAVSGRGGGGGERSKEWWGFKGLNLSFSSTLQTALQIFYIVQTSFI